jgi:hypothetical protein
MKTDDMRIAVAEACGWVYHENPPSYWKWYHPDCGWASVDELPNYPADLNATHEAEKVLDDDHWDRYLENLATVVEARRCYKASEADPRSFAHATALQRCEAFLRTLNLYKE